MVKPSTLRRNPRNWRLHGDGQRELYGALRAEVGIVDALIARETRTGLELIDGHMRSEEEAKLGDEPVPVLVVDLDDAEADKILATLDPLASMAEAADRKRSELLATLQTEHAALRRFIVDEAESLLKAEKAASEQVTTQEAGANVEGMPLEPHEHYDFLVVLCTSTHEWHILCDKLGLKPEKRRGRMGTCRAVRAAALLTLLADGK